MGSVQPGMCFSHSFPFGFGFLISPKDGVICAEMEASLDFVLPSPPPYHTFAEVPIVKEAPSE